MRRFMISLFVASMALVSARDVCSSAATQEVWSQYVVAKRRFQMDTFDLLSRQWRDIEHTLILQRDQQLTLIAMRDLEFRWLAENAPDRLVTDQGLSELSNFDWTDADSEALRSESKDFRTLEMFLEYTNGQLASDETLAQARRRMMSIYTDERYVNLAGRFRSHMETLEARLQASHENEPDR